MQVVREEGSSGVSRCSDRQSHAWIKVILRPTLVIPCLGKHLAGIGQFQLCHSRTPPLAILWQHSPESKLRTPLIRHEEVIAVQTGAGMNNPIWCRVQVPASMTASYTGGEEEGRKRGSGRQMIAADEAVRSVSWVGGKVLGQVQVPVTSTLPLRGQQPWHQRVSLHHALQGFSPSSHSV